MASMCISLMTNGVQHLFTCFSVGVSSLGEMSTQTLCLFEKSVCLFVVEVKEFFIYSEY